MAAQKIVQRGICWRVGNRRKIWVWIDKWVPGSTSQEVISPRGISPLDTRVVILLMLKTGAGNRI